MHKLTDAEFEEFQALRAYHKRQLMLESAGDVSLEQDIDGPIRRCVMAFALLGCEPEWSCCGFDYTGQPIHKWHEYGRTFFNLVANPKSLDVVERFMRLGMGTAWKAEPYTQNGVRMIALSADFAHIDQWNDKDCIHYPEPATHNIMVLQEYLMSRSAGFQDEVILRDSNVASQGHFKHWQYPPKADWVIRKSDLLNEPT